MNELKEQPLTVIMPEDVVYMPIVIHGTPYDNSVPLIKYLSMALDINKEVEFFLHKGIAFKVCLEDIYTPVVLFAISFEDVAIVRESQVVNIALKLRSPRDKLYKIESSIIETLTIHEELAFGFNHVIR